MKRKNKNLPKHPKCYGLRHCLEMCVQCVFRHACEIATAHEENPETAAHVSPIPSHCVGDGVDSFLSINSRKMARAKKRSALRHADATIRASLPIEEVNKVAVSIKPRAYRDVSLTLSRVFDDVLEYEDKLVYSHRGDVVCTQTLHKKYGVKLRWSGPIAKELFPDIDTTGSARRTATLHSKTQTAGQAMKILYLKQIVSWAKEVPVEN